MLQYLNIELFTAAPFNVVLYYCSSVFSWAVNFELFNIALFDVALFDTALFTIALLNIVLF